MTEWAFLRASIKLIGLVFLVFGITSGAVNLVVGGLQYLQGQQAMRQLRTSPSQLYRLLNENNIAKSLPQMFIILNTLNYDIDIVLKKGSMRKTIEWSTRRRTKLARPSQGI